MPVADEGDTVAVIVAGCPATGEAGDSARPMVAAFFTIALMEPDAGRFSVSPGKLAVRVWEPAAKADVEKEATPPERVAVPKTIAPSRN